MKEPGFPLGSISDTNMISGKHSRQRRGRVTSFPDFGGAAMVFPCRHPFGNFIFMTDYEKLFDFKNLLKAHKKARRGKQGKREVIEFEMNLSQNLCTLAEELRKRTYHIQGYYCFHVYEPKKRTIHALRYRDRIVQHCLCDEVLEPLFERHLIYDNAACRKGKGDALCHRQL
jgi:hypothetical protein